LLTLLLSGLLLGANSDPVIGRWRLNWEKSQSKGSAPKSVIRTYAKFHDGFRVSEVWIDQDGKTTKFIYPISHEGGSTITFTRLDANVAEGVSKTKEIGTYTLKRAVSNDGKRLTIETIGTDSSGKYHKNVLVYEKMK
jgi:hypothetical protein